MIKCVIEHDYNNSLFSCKIKKQNLVGKYTRFIYVFEDKIIINRDQKQGNPARIIYFSELQKIQWNYSKSQNNNKQLIKGFTLYQNNCEELKYYGDYEMMIALKKIIGKFVLQSCITDEYEIQHILGEGNYGVVYQLKNIFTKQFFAGKCLEKNKIQKVEKGKLAVMNEIEIMRILSPHPQIVNLHEVFDQADNMHFILDLCKGSNLQTILCTRQQILDTKEIKIIMYYLLTAMEYIHSNGIMHRDIKPENILFSTPYDFSTLKIGDFGLAAIQNQAPYLYSKCGTPGYVAPEVANLVDKSIEYSCVCDIFSCGAVFHLLLMGEGLFPGNGHLELLKLNKECKINLEDQKYKKLSKEEKHLLSAMLQIDPVLRITASKLLKYSYFQLEKIQFFSETMISHEEKESQETDDNCTPIRNRLEKRYSFSFLSTQRKFQQKIA